jgi:cytochrome c oxidase subunit IV
MAEHVVSKKVYFAVYVVLLALTFTTAGVSYINLGPFSTFVAMAIAIFKATLVVLFFMHIRYTRNGLYWIAFLVGIFWLGILIVLTMGDYLTRVWLAYPSRVPF